jgi:cytochrome b561
MLAYITGGDPTVHLKSGEIHVLAGISVFLLFFIRIITIFIYRKDLPLNKPLNKYQKKNIFDS